MSASMRVLGTDPVARAVASLTRDRLRVLAYHGVPDQVAFSRQLDYLRRRYVLVSGADVIAACRGLGELPGRAVWITFDDGQRLSLIHI